MKKFIVRQIMLHFMFSRGYKWAGQAYLRPTKAKKWAGRGPPGPIASAAYAQGAWVPEPRHRAPAQNATGHGQWAPCTILHVHSQQSLVSKKHRKSNKVYQAVHVATQYASAPLPLQVDNIFVFIHQVAPVLARWLFKTSTTSRPFDRESGVCANYSLHRPLCCRVRHQCTRQTDRCILQNTLRSDFGCPKGPKIRPRSLRVRYRYSQLPFGGRAADLYQV